MAINFGGHQVTIGDFTLPTSDGSSGQVLQTDGSGSISFATIADTNYYLNNITKDGNTLTFGVNGASDVTYTFGSNAFTSYTDHSIQGYLTSLGTALVDADFASAGIMATDGSGTYSIVTNNSANWNTAYGWGNHGIRTDNFRYIRYQDGSEEFYDKQADPNEWYNLAGKAEVSKDMKDLRKYLPEKDIPYTKHSVYTFTPYFRKDKELHSE